MWKRLFWLYAVLPPGTLPKWLQVRILGSRIRPSNQAEMEWAQRRMGQLNVNG